jgi:dTDP-glucose 4,6-dehydratase
MRTVLVTGGAGFIGSNFVHRLLDADPAVRIVTLDALTYAGSRENLKDLPDPSRHIFVHGDICDAAVVGDAIRSHVVDTIVHFAAESHVDRSILGPMPFVQTNVIGTATLLEAARQAWLVDGLLPESRVRFHHISTDEVFGSLGPADPAFTETTPYAPRSPYAASKAASDHVVRAYSHTYGLPITISNCSNNYGPRQFPEKLIPLLILNALEGKRLPVYGDGQQVRDWLFVDDHCAAVMAILLAGRPGETYNIGGGTQPANLDIVQQVCSLLDDLVPNSPHAPHARLITHVPDRPGHDRRYAMDIHKIRAELSWSPSESLTSGLRKTVLWYLANPAWVAAIRRQPAFQAWLEANYAGRGATA